MEPLILVSIAISFFITYLTLPLWIKKAKQIGLMWEDMNKTERPKIAGSGGAMVVLGFSIGVLMYVALQTFIFNSSTHLIEILALFSVILLVSGIALIDDLFGWRKGGLSKRSRIILVIFTAIPLMVINAGTSSVFLPIIGGIDLGIIYPLIFIPMGILGATTTYNFLAGYNGLEASQGILVLGALSIVTYITGNPWLSVICLYGVSVLLAFYIFNFHPARVFPGDIMTYAVGALIATVAILGNIEKIAIIFFIPYIIEFFLKVRGKLNKPSFGKTNSDGSLEVPYKKMYGLTHISIKILKKIKGNKKVYEKEVVWLINVFQLIFILIGFLIL